MAIDFSAGLSNRPPTTQEASHVHFLITARILDLAPPSTTFIWRALRLRQCIILSQVPGYLW